MSYRKDDKEKSPLKASNLFSERAGEDVNDLSLVFQNSSEVP